MKRLIPAVVLIAVSMILVISAVPGSPGRSIRQSARQYLSALDGGRPEEARLLLTDSLAGMISLQALAILEPDPSAVPAGIGREEPRGWPLGLAVPGGGSRLLWFRLEDADWRISGDTRLDALMGSASITCREYVLATVLPAAASGIDPSSFSCPVSGLPYSIEEGMLSCPAGHLGEGLDLLGDACALKREEAAAVVGSWVAAGNPFPQSFSEIWEESGGAMGLRGGFRCPVNGYSYFTLVDSGVWCPYHQLLTPVDIP